MFRGDFRKKVSKKGVKRSYFACLYLKWVKMTQKHVKITKIVLNQVLAASWWLVTDLGIKG